MDALTECSAFKHSSCSFRQALKPLLSGSAQFQFKIGMIRDDVAGSPCLKKADIDPGIRLTIPREGIEAGHGKRRREKSVTPFLGAHGCVSCRPVKGDIPFFSPQKAIRRKGDLSTRKLTSKMRCQKHINIIQQATGNNGLRPTATFFRGLKNKA